MTCRVALVCAGSGSSWTGRASEVRSSARVGPLSACILYKLPRRQAGCEPKHRPWRVNAPGCEEHAADAGGLRSPHRSLRHHDRSLAPRLRRHRGPRDPEAARAGEGGASFRARARRLRRRRPAVLCLAPGANRGSRSSHGVPVFDHGRERPGEDRGQRPPVGRPDDVGCPCRVRKRPGDSREAGRSRASSRAASTAFSFRSSRAARSRATWRSISRARMSSGCSKPPGVSSCSRPSSGSGASSSWVASSSSRSRAGPKTSPSPSKRPSTDPTDAPAPALQGRVRAGGSRGGTGAAGPGRCASRDVASTGELQRPGPGHGHGGAAPPAEPGARLREPARPRAVRRRPPSAALRERWPAVRESLEPLFVRLRDGRSHVTAGPRRPPGRWSGEAAGRDLPARRAGLRRVPRPAERSRHPRRARDRRPARQPAPGRRTRLSHGGPRAPRSLERDDDPPRPPAREPHPAEREPRGQGEPGAIRRRPS